MTLQEVNDKIEIKYGDKLTPFIILSRAVSLPETETTELQIARLARKKLKDEDCDIEGAIKDLIKRYKTPKQYKISNFKNYI